MKRKNTKRDRKKYENSLRIGEQIWGRETSSKTQSLRECPGHMFEDCWERHLSALRRSHKTHTQSSRLTPFNEIRDAAAAFNESGFSCETLDKVLDTFMVEAKKPNNMQRRFLHRFVKRLKLEWLEKHRGTTNAIKSEPMLDVIHGFPGTGKSAVITWMRRLMEQGLGWTHGIQFVCLAFQNSMAAQINGYTVHHWTGIPARSDDAAAYGDRHKQSQKCGALRVIIIDEDST